jgi:hypothetical protein
MKKGFTSRPDFLILYSRRHVILVVNPLCWHLIPVDVDLHDRGRAGSGIFYLVCVQSPKPVILSSGLQSVVQNFMPGILPVQKHSVRTKVLLKKPLDIGMWKLQRLFQDLEHR